MLDAPAMALRIAATPFWLLWRGYLTLWWAFDDSPERAAARLSAKTTAAADVAPVAFLENGESGQASAFEVVDSRKPTKPPLPPPMPRPEGLLKGAFAGSIVLSLLCGLLASALVAGDAISPARGAALWLWFCLIVLVGSVLVVRRIARKRWEKPRGPIARAKDATVHAARAARDATVDRAMAAIHFIRGKRQSAPATAPPGVTADADHAQSPQPVHGSARKMADAAHRTYTRLVPAVARGARGVLDPLRDRAAVGLAWASRKVAKHS